MDFKRELPLEKKAQGKELAKDICCFANSQGGYLVIGVENTTKKRLGIDPGSLDTEMIFRIARDRITPPVLSIKAWEESYEGLVFGIVKIGKTNEVHHTGGVHYIRVYQDCIKADTSIITKLALESKMYRIEENKRLEEEAIRKFMQIESAEVDAIIKKCVEERFKDGLFEQISDARREKNWLRRNLLENRITAFRDACSISIDPDNSEIDEGLTALISIRGVGLLAMAHSQYFSEHEDRKIRIVLEFDPDIKNEKEDEYYEKGFFDWARKFRNFQEQEGDSALLVKKKASSDLGFLIDTSKAFRTLHLKDLMIKMLEIENELLRETPSIALLYWLYTTALSVDSTWQLAKGKSTYVGMMEKQQKRVSS